jgi:hypothetical protein
MSKRPHVRPTAAVAAVLALAAVAGLGACGKDEGFDSEAYCAAIANPGPVLDAKALIDGDEATLQTATELYASIASQAPPELKDDWSVLVDGLDSMLQAARGERDVTDSNHDAFTDAFTVIQQDKHERCGV